MRILITFFFTIKDTNLYVPAVTLSARDNQNHQSFVAKDVKYPCIGINIKQKGKIKMQLFVSVYSN